MLSFRRLSAVCLAAAVLSASSVRIGTEHETDAHDHHVKHKKKHTDPDMEMSMMSKTLYNSGVTSRDTMNPSDRWGFNVGKPKRHNMAISLPTRMAGTYGGMIGGMTAGSVAGPAGGMVGML